MRIVCLNRYIFLFGFILTIGSDLRAGGYNNFDSMDTLRVKAGMLVIYPDTFFVTVADTMIYTDGKKVRLKPDPYARSKSFYDSLAVKSGKSRMKEELYRLFIRDNNPVFTTSKNEKTREEYFSAYNGRVVRNIRTLRIPILDGNVNDTSGVDSSALGRLINWHPQTRQWILRGRGVLQAGDRIRDNSLADLERLVRELSTIRDARLYVIPVAGTDSIDLLMAAQDLFPLRLNIDFRSPDRYIVRLTDRNITGSAVEAGITYERSDKLKPQHVYNISLRNANLFNRFVTGRAYAFERGSRKEQGAEMGRDFLSSALKGMGGAFLKNVNDRVFADSSESRYNMLRGGLWYGHAFESRFEWLFVPALSMEMNIFNKNSDFVKGFGYPYYDNRKVLASVSVFHRRFLRSALVKVFGTSEYIPVGYKLDLTAGYEDAAEFNRRYLGASAEFAKYIHDAGYFGLRLNNSAFMKDGLYTDRLWTGSINYYTPLLKWGRVRFRQFAEVLFKQLKNPFSLPSFGVNGPWEDSLGVGPKGDQLHRFGLKSVFFMPWYLYGFRFSFYEGADLMLLKNVVPYRHDYTYLPSFRLGIRIQNDHLTYTAFSFQAEWFPSTNDYEPFFSFKLKSFVIPLFQGLRAGRPAFFDGSEE